MHFYLFYYYVADSRAFICCLISLLIRALLFVLFILVLIRAVLSVPLLRYWFLHFYLFLYYVTDSRTFICSLITMLIRGVFFSSFIMLLICALSSVLFLHYWFAHVHLFHYDVTNLRTFICSLITLLIRAVLSYSLLRYWFALLLSVLLLRYWFAHFYLFPD